MLEGWVASQLQRWLGDYVQPDCFDAARVQLDVWSGYVVLSRLILRPDALDFLGLPVTLRRGSIARVELQIPWGSAAKSNDPTVVTIDKVFLLLETQYDIDSHRHDAFNAAAIRSKLDAVEKAQIRARERAARRVTERQRAQKPTDKSSSTLTSLSPTIAVSTQLRREMVHASSIGGVDIHNFENDNERFLSSESELRGKGGPGGEEEGVQSHVSSLTSTGNEVDQQKQQQQFSVDLLSELESLRDDGKLSSVDKTSSLESSKTMDGLGSDETNVTTTMPGFFQKLLTEVIRNLEIHIRGVHIRWVDRVSSPMRPFAMGLCAQTIHVYNVKDAQFSTSKSSISSPLSKLIGEANLSPSQSTVADQRVTPPKSFFGVAISAFSSGAGRVSSRLSSTPDNSSSAPNQVKDESSQALPRDFNEQQRAVSKGLEIDMLSAYVQVSATHNVALWHTSQTSSSTTTYSSTSSSTFTSTINDAEFIPTIIDGVDLLSCELVDYERSMERIVPMRGRSIPTNTKESRFRTRSSSSGGAFSTLSSNLNLEAGNASHVADENGGESPITSTMMPAPQLSQSHIFFDAFALPPLNANCQVVFSRSQQDTSVPQQYIETQVSRLSLRFQSKQFSAIMALSSGFESFKLRRKFDQIRPIQRLIVWRSQLKSKGNVTSKYTSMLSSSSSSFAASGSANANNGVSGIQKSLIDPTRSRIARSWWRFAVRACVEDISRSGPYMRWRCIVERRTFRVAYIWLYKRLRCGYHSPRQWGSHRVRALQRLQARRAALDDDVTNDDKEETVDNNKRRRTTSSNPITATSFPSRVNTFDEKPGMWLHRHSLASLLRQVLDEKVFARPWIKWASRYKSFLTILTTTDSPVDFVANADNGSNDLHISSSLPSPSALSSTVKTDQDEIAVAASFEDWVKVDALLKIVEPIDRATNEYTRLNAHELSLLELLEERLGADDLYIFRLLAESQINAEGGVAHLKECAKKAAEKRKLIKHASRMSNANANGKGALNIDSDDDVSIASSLASYASSLADTPKIEFAVSSLTGVIDAATAAAAATSMSLSTTGTESDVSSDAHVELDPLPGRRKHKRKQLLSLPKVSGENSTKHNDIEERVKNDGKSYDDDHISVQSDFSRSDSGDDLHDDEYDLSTVNRRKDRLLQSSTRRINSARGRNKGRGVTSSTEDDNQNYDGNDHGAAVEDDDEKEEDNIESNLNPSLQSSSSYAASSGGIAGAALKWLGLDWLTNGEIGADGTGDSRSRIAGEDSATAAGTERDNVNFSRASLSSKSGRNFSSRSAQQGKAPDIAVMSSSATSAEDTQRREIFAAIGYDPRVVLQPYHSGYVVTHFIFLLSSASITLLVDESSSSSSSSSTSFDGQSPFLVSSSLSSSSSLTKIIDKKEQALRSLSSTSTLSNLRLRPFLSLKLNVVTVDWQQRPTSQKINFSLLDASLQQDNGSREETLNNSVNRSDGKIHSSTTSTSSLTSSSTSSSSLIGHSKAPFSTVLCAASYSQPQSLSNLTSSRKYTVSGDVDDKYGRDQSEQSRLKSTLEEDTSFSVHQKQQQSPISSSPVSSLSGVLGSRTIKPALSSSSLSRPPSSTGLHRFQQQQQQHRNPLVDQISRDSENASTRVAPITATKRHPLLYLSLETFPDDAEEESDKSVFTTNDMNFLSEKHGSHMPGLPRGVAYDGGGFEDVNSDDGRDDAASINSAPDIRLRASSSAALAANDIAMRALGLLPRAGSSNRLFIDDGSNESVRSSGSGGGGNGFKGGRTRAKSKALLERKEAQKVEDLENKKRAFRKPLWTSGAKVAVTLRLLPLEIVVSREATIALRAFFNEPSSLISSPSYIRHASSSSIHLKESPLDQFRRFISPRSIFPAAFGKRSNQELIALDVELDAPILLFPADELNPRTEMLVVDLGLLSVKSSSSTQSSVNQTLESTVSSNTGSGIASGSLRPSNTTSVDMYKFALTKTRVLLSRADIPWRDPNHQLKRGLLLCQPISMDVSVRVDLSRLEFSGKSAHHPSSSQTYNPIAQENSSRSSPSSPLHIDVKIPNFSMRFSDAQLAPMLRIALKYAGPTIIQAPPRQRVLQRNDNNYNVNQGAIDLPTPVDNFFVNDGESDGSHVTLFKLPLSWKNQASQQHRANVRSTTSATLDNHPLRGGRTSSPFASPLKFRRAANPSRLSTPLNEANSRSNSTKIMEDVASNGVVSQRIASVMGDRPTTSTSVEKDISSMTLQSSSSSSPSPAVFSSLAVIFELTFSLERFHIQFTQCSSSTLEKRWDLNWPSADDATSALSSSSPELSLDDSDFIEFIAQQTRSSIKIREFMDKYNSNSCSSGAPYLHPNNNKDDQTAVVEASFDIFSISLSDLDQASFGKSKFKHIFSNNSNLSDGGQISSFKLTYNQRFSLLPPAIRGCVVDESCLDSYKDQFTSWADNTMSNRTSNSLYSPQHYGINSHRYISDPESLQTNHLSLYLAPSTLVLNQKSLSTLTSNFIVPILQSRIDTKVSVKSSSSDTATSVQAHHHTNAQPKDDKGSSESTKNGQSDIDSSSSSSLHSVICPENGHFLLRFLQLKKHSNVSISAPSLQVVFTAHGGREIANAKFANSSSDLTNHSYEDCTFYSLTHSRKENASFALVRHQNDKHWGLKGRLGSVRFDDTILPNNPVSSDAGREGIRADDSQATVQRLVCKGRSGSDSSSDNFESSETVPITKSFIEFEVSLLPVLDFGSGNSSSSASTSANSNSSIKQSTNVCDLSSLISGDLRLVPRPINIREVFSVTARLGDVRVVTDATFFTLFFSFLRSSDLFPLVQKVVKMSSSTFANKSKALIIKPFQSERSHKHEEVEEEGEMTINTVKVNVESVSIFVPKAWNGVSSTFLKRRDAECDLKTPIDSPERKKETRRKSVEGGGIFTVGEYDESPSVDRGDDYLSSPQYDEDAIDTSCSRSLDEDLIDERGLREFVTLEIGPVKVSTTFCPYQSQHIVYNDETDNKSTETRICQQLHRWSQRISFSLQKVNIQAIRRLTLTDEDSDRKGGAFELPISHAQGRVTSFHGKIVRDFNIDGTLTLHAPSLQIQPTVSFENYKDNKRDALIILDIAIGDVVMDVADAFILLLGEIWYQNGSKLLQFGKDVSLEFSPSTSVTNDSSSSSLSLTSSRLSMFEVALKISNVWLHLSREKEGSDLPRSNSGRSSLVENNNSNASSGLYSHNLSLMNLASIHLDDIEAISTRSSTMHLEHELITKLSVSNITAKDTRIDQGGFHSLIYSSSRKRLRQSSVLEQKKMKLLTLMFSFVSREDSPLSSLLINATLEASRLHIIPSFIIDLLAFYRRCLSHPYLQIIDDYRSIFFQTTEDPDLPSFGRRLESTSSIKSKTNRHISEKMTITMMVTMLSPEIWFSPSQSSQHAIVARGSTLSVNINLLKVSGILGSTGAYGEFIQHNLTSAIKAIKMKDEDHQLPQRPQPPSAIQSSTSSSNSSNLASISSISSTSSSSSSSASSSTDFRSADFAITNLGLFLHEVITNNFSDKDDFQPSPSLQRSSSTSLWGTEWVSSSSPSSSLLQKMKFKKTPTSSPVRPTAATPTRTSTIADYDHRRDFFENLSAFPTNIPTTPTPHQRSFVQFVSGGQGISPDYNINNQQEEEGRDQVNNATIGIVRRIILPFSINLKAESRDVEASPLVINVSEIISKRAERRNEGIWAERAENAAAAVIGGVLAAARSLGSLAKSLSSTTAATSSSISQEVLNARGVSSVTDDQEDDMTSSSSSSSSSSSPHPPSSPSPPPPPPIFVQAEVEGMLREITHYNREASKQASGVLAVALEKLPKINTSSAERLQKKNFSRPILAQQVLTYHAARVFVDGPISICLSQNELLFLITVIESVNVLSRDITQSPSSISSLSSSSLSLTSSPPVDVSLNVSSTDPFTAQGNGQVKPSPPSYEILPVLRPSPSCYAAHIELSSIRLLFVKRDSLDRNNSIVIRPTSSLQQQQQQRLQKHHPRNMDSTTCNFSKWNGVSTPLLRIELTQAMILLNAAPVLGTMRAKGSISMDHSNPLVARWESLLEPWPSDVLVAVLRSSLSSSSSSSGTNTISARRRRVGGGGGGIYDATNLPSSQTSFLLPIKPQRSARVSTDDFALSSATIIRSSGTVWYPHSLLSKVTVDGLKLLRRHAEGTLWNDAAFSNSDEEDGRSTRRWYDFGKEQEKGDNYYDLYSDDLLEGSGDDSSFVSRLLPFFTSKEASDHQLSSLSSSSTAAADYETFSNASSSQSHRILQPLEVTLSSVSPLRVNASTAGIASLTAVSLLLPQLKTKNTTSSSNISSFPSAPTEDSSEDSTSNSMSSGSFLYWAQNDTGCELQYVAENEKRPHIFDKKSARRLQQGVRTPILAPGTSITPYASSKEQDEEGIGNDDTYNRAIDSELFAWPSERQWPKPIYESEPSCTGGLRLRLSMALPTLSSLDASIVSSSKSMNASNFPSTMETALNNDINELVINTKDEDDDEVIGKGKEGRGEISVECWQPLLHGFNGINLSTAAYPRDFDDHKRESISGKQNDNDINFGSLTSESSSAKLVFSQAIPGTSLPHTVAVYESYVSFNDHNRHSSASTSSSSFFPLTRNIRIRSTLSVANFLDCNVRFEALLVPRSDAIGMTTVNSNQSTLSPLWSCPLEPFSACWVPAPLAHWASTSSLSSSSSLSLNNPLNKNASVNLSSDNVIVFRLIVAEQHCIHIQTKEMEPPTLTSFNKVSQRSSLRPLEKFNHHTSTSSTSSSSMNSHYHSQYGRPSIYSSVSWGVNAHRLMRVCRPAVNESKSDDSSSVEDQKLQSARARSFEQFLCHCSSSRLSLSSSSLLDQNDSSCSRCKGRGSVWPSYKPCGAVQHDNSIGAPHTSTKDSLFTSHGFLSCLSFHAPVSFQNRLPKACDVMVSQLKTIRRSSSNVSHPLAISQDLRSIMSMNNDNMKKVAVDRSNLRLEKRIFRLSPGSNLQFLVHEGKLMMNDSSIDSNHQVNSSFSSSSSLPTEQSQGEKLVSIGSENAPFILRVRPEGMHGWSSGVLIPSSIGTLVNNDDNVDTVLVPIPLGATATSSTDSFSSMRHRRHNLRVWLRSRDIYGHSTHVGLDTVRCTHGGLRFNLFASNILVNRTSVPIHFESMLVTSKSGPFSFSSSSSSSSLSHKTPLQDHSEEENHVAVGEYGDSINNEEKVSFTENRITISSLDSSLSLSSMMRHMFSDANAFTSIAGQDHLESMKRVGRQQEQELEPLQQQPYHRSLRSSNQTSSEREQSSSSSSSSNNNSISFVFLGPPDATPIGRAISTNSTFTTENAIDNSTIEFKTDEDDLFDWTFRSVIEKKEITFRVTESIQRHQQQSSTSSSSSSSSTTTSSKRWRIRVRSRHTEPSPSFAVSTVPSFSPISQIDKPSLPLLYPDAGGVFASTFSSSVSSSSSLPTHDICLPLAAKNLSSSANGIKEVITANKSESSLSHSPLLLRASAHVFGVRKHFLSHNQRCFCSHRDKRYHNDMIDDYHDDDNDDDDDDDALLPFYPFLRRSPSQHSSMSLRIPPSIIITFVPAFVAQNNTPFPLYVRLAPLPQNQIVNTSLLSEVDKDVNDGSDDNPSTTCVRLLRLEPGESRALHPLHPVLLPRIDKTTATSSHSHLLFPLSAANALLSATTSGSLLSSSTSTIAAAQSNYCVRVAAVLPSSFASATATFGQSSNKPFSGVSGLQETDEITTHWSGRLMLSHDALDSAKKARLSGIRDGTSIDRAICPIIDPETLEKTLVDGKLFSSTLLSLPCPSFDDHKDNKKNDNNYINSCHFQYPTFLRVIRSQAGNSSTNLIDQNVNTLSSLASAKRTILSKSSSLDFYDESESFSECNTGSSVISFFELPEAHGSTTTSKGDQDNADNHSKNNSISVKTSTSTTMMKKVKKNLSLFHQNDQSKLLDSAPFILVNRTKFNFSFSQSDCPIRCVASSKSSPSPSSSSSSVLHSSSETLIRSPTLSFVAGLLPAGAVIPYSWYEPEVLPSPGIISSGIGSSTHKSGNHLLSLNYRISTDDDLDTNTDAKSIDSDSDKDEGTRRKATIVKDVFLGRFDISSPGVTLLKGGSDISSSFFFRHTIPIPSVDLVLQVLIVPRQRDFVRIVCLQTASQPVGVPFNNNSSILSLSTSTSCALLSSSSLSSLATLSASPPPPPFVDHSSFDHNRNIDSGLFQNLSSSSSVPASSIKVSDAELFFSLLGQANDGGRGERVSSLSSSSLTNLVQHGANAGHLQQQYHNNSSHSTSAIPADNPINAVLGRHARLHLRLSSVIINLVNSSSLSQSRKDTQNTRTSGTATLVHGQSSISSTRISSSLAKAAFIPADHIAGVHVMSLFISGIDLTATDEGFVPIAASLRNGLETQSRKETRQSSMTSANVSSSIFSSSFSSGRTESTIPAPLHPVSRSLTLQIGKISVYRPSSASPHIYKEVIYMKDHSKLSVNLNQQQDDPERESISLETSSSSSLPSLLPFSSLHTTSSSGSPNEDLNLQQQLQHFFTLSVTQTPFRIKVPGDAAVVAVDPFSWRNLGFATTQVNVDIQPGRPTRPLCICLSLDLELMESLFKYITIAERMIKNRQHHLQQQSFNFKEYIDDIDSFPLLLREVSEPHKQNESSSSLHEDVGLSRSIGISVHSLRSAVGKQKSNHERYDHHQPQSLFSPFVSSSSSAASSSTSNNATRKRKTTSMTLKRRISRAPALKSEFESITSYLPPFISRLSLTQGFILQVTWEGRQKATTHKSSNKIDNNHLYHDIDCLDCRRRLFAPQYAAFLSILRQVPSTSTTDPLSIAIPKVSISDTAVSLPGNKSLFDVFIDTLIPRLALQQLFSPWRLASLLQFGFAMWRGGGGGGGGGGKESDDIDDE